MGHRTLDHTADLALEVWAESEAGLYRELACALLAELTDTVPDGGAEVRIVTVDAEDAGERLVRFGNEILYLAITEGFLPSRIEVVLDGAVARGTLTGRAEAHHHVVAELKSVTYHELHLAEEGDDWRARLVVDV